MTIKRVGGGGAGPKRDRVPIAEVPNPEYRQWRNRTDHEAGDEGPPPWATLHVDLEAVDGAAMLRFMREARSGDMAAMGAVYDLLTVALGPDMAVLERAGLTAAELAEIAGEVVGRITAG